MAAVPMMRARHVIVAIGVATSTAACAVAPRRFPLREPVWVDDDLRPVSVPCRVDDEPPKAQVCAPDDYESPFGWDVADKTLFRPVTRFFAMDIGFEAKNVNSLDEVPDSSWFTNRIGASGMTTEDIVRGSCDGKTIDDAPRTDGSWLIDKGKTNGANPGFRVKIEGIGKFLLKADDPHEGEKATGATAIATRLYHAAGWWVACDTVVYIEKRWLRLKPGLTYADNTHEKHPFDEAKLDSILDSAQRRDGRIRMVASRWLPGRMLGPFHYEDTRDDDPNDVIPHEDRRDLRGARLIAAWLGHFDSREQNTMTSWAALDSSKPDTSPGHTIHWYIDLGDCFGSHWEWESWNRRIGHSYYFDPGDIAVDFLTLGMLERPWDRPTPNRDLPMFDYYLPKFEPDAWKGGYPNPAFARMTERDGAWAARIISRFSDDHIGAAVSLGDYTDPKAPAFLKEALIQRRDAILARYFSKLSPLSDVRVDGDRVCAVDLARLHGSFPRATYSYVAKVWTGIDLDKKASADVATGNDGEVCVSVPRVPTDSRVKDDDPRRYTVVDIANGVAAGPLRLHLYDLGEKRGLRVVGVERPSSGSRDF